jgi:hypothetical protein
MAQVVQSLLYKYQALSPNPTPNPFPPAQKKRWSQKAKPNQAGGGGDISNSLGRALWFIPAIPVLGRLRWEDLEFN